VAKSTLQIGPSDDRESVIVEVETDAGGAKFALSARELDEMVRALAAVRATLIPPVSDTYVNAPLQPLVRVQAVVPAERIGGKRVILFRHPGLGWLPFELEGNDAANFAEAIIATMRSDQAAKT